MGSIGSKAVSVSTANAARMKQDLSEFSELLDDSRNKTVKKEVDTAVKTQEKGGTKTSNNSTIMKSLQSILDKAEQNVKNNPNNMGYKRTVNEYKAYIKAAKGLDMTKTTFSGLKAALYLSHAKVGTEVTISGTGLNDGKYTLKNVPSMFTGRPAPAWVRTEDNHAFITNMATTTSELRLYNGKDDKNVKVKVNKRKK